MREQAEEPASIFGRSRPPSFFEDISEPAIDIFGTAALCATPDLGKIIAVKIMSLVLHGITPNTFGENATYAATSGDIPTVRWHEARPIFPEYPKSLCSKSLCSK